MIDYRAGLREFLLGLSAISTLVDAERIYAVTVPQNERQDSIAIAEISGTGHHHMQGASAIGERRVQIDCWAQDPDRARTLANLVQDRIDGYRGPMGSGQHLVQVQGVFFDSAREIFDADAELYKASRDYRLIWETS